MKKKEHVQEHLNNFNNIGTLFHLLCFRNRYSLINWERTISINLFSKWLLLFTVKNAGFYDIFDQTIFYTNYRRHFFMIHYRKILELHDEGISLRGIAASTGNSRQKVTEVIQLAGVNVMV